MTDFKSRYRADEVPWYWWLQMQVYGWLVGALIYLYTSVVSLTSRISFEGEPLDPAGNYIYCFWHQHMFNFLCLAARRSKFAMFVNPIWYMKPIHVWARLSGIKRFALGSSGNNGMNAADIVVGYLKAGDNTFFYSRRPLRPSSRFAQRGTAYILAKWGPLATHGNADIVPHSP